MKKRLLQTIGLALVTALVMSSTTACFGLKKDKQEDSDIEISAEIDEFETDSEEEEFDAGEGIVVTTAEEFVEAIAPDTMIVVDSPCLNLSEYITEIWEQDREGWNAEHEYVQVEECYDGAQLVVQNVDGLNITGSTTDYADTELVVDPRYADCMKFVDSTNISFSYITIGHTEQGDCMGDVLKFINCQDVYLLSIDLYGCGVYAISATSGSGEISVMDSTLRDCSGGAFYIEGAEGGFYFTNCILDGSLGIPYFDENEASWLEFYGCTFGQKETEGLIFSDVIYADEECVWSEDIEYYPEYPEDGEYEEDDYGEDYEDDYEEDEGFMDLSPENFKSVSLEEYDFYSYYWDAMFIEDVASGDIEYFTGTENDYFNLCFWDDLTGSMDRYGTESEFTWSPAGGNVIEINAGGEILRAEFVEEVENEGSVWVKIKLGEQILWFM